MNCHDFHRRLESAVEARGSSEEERSRLEQHVRDCPHTECRRKWDDHELLALLVPSWTNAVPRVSLANLALSALRRSRDNEGMATGAHQPRRAFASSINHPQWDAGPVEIKPRPVAAVSVPGISRLARREPASRTERPTRWWLALAATVAPLLLLIPAIRLGGTHTPEPIVQQESPVPPLRIVPYEPSQAVDEPVAVSEMFRTFASVPQSASRLMSETVVLLDADPSSEPHVARPTGFAPWNGRLTDQLEPWGRELSTAFDAFLESVTNPPPAKSSRLEPEMGQGDPVAA